MIIQVLHCRFCRSANVIRHGKDKADHQRSLCHDCRRTFREQPGTRAHSPQFRARVLAAYHERASLCGVCRVFGIGRKTLSEWLKKADHLPPLEQTLAPA